MPKPPPTSWVSTRIVVSGTLNTPSASSLRTTATPCVRRDQRVALASPRPTCRCRRAAPSRPAQAACRRAARARHARRCAKAASTAAALPSVQSSAMLPGRASWIAGAPLRDRALDVGRARRVRRSRCAPLRRRPAPAPASPPPRSRPARRHSGCGRPPAPASRRRTSACRRGRETPRPAGSRRARRPRDRVPVKTPSTPGIARAARDIDAADRRMADRRAHEHAVGLARHVEVVGEPPAAGEQRLVLAAQRAVIAAEACACCPSCQVRRLPCCGLQRWLHAAKSQVGLTPARGADEIADQGITSSIMAEGGAANKHPRCRATSGTAGCHDKHKQAHGRAHAHARKIRARRIGFGRRRDRSPASPASAQAQDKGPIRIGFLPPITGPLASPGAEMVNGFRLFWEQAGMTAGGRKVEIVTGDTTCNPDQALTQARRLVLQEKVHFMVGPLCGHEGPAVAQVSKETGVPLVMDAAGADNVTKWDRTPTVVRTAISSSQIGHPFGEYLYKELGLRNVTFIGQDYTFGHEVTLGAIKTFTGARRQGRAADLESDRHQGLRHHHQHHSRRHRRRRRDHRRRRPHPPVRRLVQLRHGQEAQDLRRLLAAGRHAAAGRRPRGRPDQQFAAICRPASTRRRTRRSSTPMRRSTSGCRHGSPSRPIPPGLWTKAAIDSINGNVEDRDAFLKAMRTVQIKAPRGPLKLDAYDNPIQNVYVAQGREDKASGARRRADQPSRSRPTRRCRSSGPGSPRSSSRAAPTSADAS